MGNDRPAVRIWVGTVAVMAFAVTLWSFRSGAGNLADWAALAVLATCAGLAHWFPIRSATDGASFRLTNVFMIAGSAMLPSGLLSVLAFGAVAPDVWQRRHRGLGRVLIGLVFNFSQTALAAHATNAWVHRLGHDDIGLWSAARDLVALAGGALVFTAVQESLVAVVVSLSSGVPITRVSTFSMPAVLSNSLVAVLGVIVTGLWQAKPVLLLLLPPILIITHRMTRNAHLAHLAQVDTKTGLHNYRYFERVLEEELAHSLRAKRPLALVFADLDHFKRVNDQFGHAAGDAVLRQLSQLLTGLVRKGDVVARFGGEEFVVLLPGTVADEAAYLAERVRVAVEAFEFDIENGRTLRCTVSLGVAAYPDDASDFATLLSRADEAMYRAKQTRNAVARAEIVPPVSSVLPTVLGNTPRIAAVPATAQATATGPAAAFTLTNVALWGTVAMGLALVIGSATLVFVGGQWATVVPFLLLSVAAELLKVQVYEADRQHRISFSFAVAVTMGTLFTVPAAAPLVNFASAVVHVVVSRQRAPEKALFNLANVALSAATAGWVFELLRPNSDGYSIWHLAAAVPAVLAYYIVNDGLISLMISLHSGRALVAVLREATWSAHIKAFMGLIGAFLGGTYQQLGYLAVAMYAMPLLILRFTLTFYAQKTQRYIENLQAAKSEAESAHHEKEEMLRKLIETVALIIDARDNSVSGHSRRVAKFAVAIGKELGMSTAEVAVLHTAGLFHDLGKVGIPEAILHKPAKLTADEYIVIKEHAALGQRILSEVPQLSDIARMVGEHHERFDGYGYPLGLASEQISIGGRILVVADALETMLADRPYSRGRDLHVALAELDRCAGSHFDPRVVDAVHRAVSAHGADFFASAERLADRDWGAADQILAQVFA